MRTWPRCDSVNDALKAGRDLIDSYKWIHVILPWSFCPEMGRLLIYDMKYEFKSIDFTVFYKIVTNIFFNSDFIPLSSGYPYIHNQ